MKKGAPERRPHVGALWNANAHHAVRALLWSVVALAIFLFRCFSYLIFLAASALCLNGKFGKESSTRLLPNPKRPPSACSQPAGFLLREAAACASCHASAAGKKYKCTSTYCATIAMPWAEPIPCFLLPKLGERIKKAKCCSRWAIYFFWCSESVLFHLAHCILLTTFTLNSPYPTSKKRFKSRSFCLRATLLREVCVKHLCAKVHA